MYFRFRETFGGLPRHEVQPDLAVFGKAIGNGYALTAVLGKRDFMDYAQSSFISSTFWTERIGPSASLKTLEVMNDMQSWDEITQTGKKIKSQWKEIFKSYGVDVTTWGLSALPGFTIKGPNSLAYKTLITQEMLKAGYLASNTIYVCTEHTPEIISGYFDELETVVKLIAQCEDGLDVNTLLDGEICHTGFRG